MWYRKIFHCEDQSFVVVGDWSVIVYCVYYVMTISKLVLPALLVGHNFHVTSLFSGSEFPTACSIILIKHIFVR